MLMGERQLHARGHPFLYPPYLAPPVGLRTTSILSIQELAKVGVTWLRICIETFLPCPRVLLYIFRMNLAGMAPILQETANNSGKGSMLFLSSQKKSSGASLLLLGKRQYLESRVITIFLVTQEWEGQDF